MQNNDFDANLEDEDGNDYDVRVYYSIHIGSGQPDDVTEVIIDRIEDRDGEPNNNIRDLFSEDTIDKLKLTALDHYLDA